MASKLSPEDQARVDDYLSAPQHQVERAPFKPLRLLFMVIVTVIVLGLFSRLLTYWLL